MRIICVKQVQPIICPFYSDMQGIYDHFLFITKQTKKKSLYFSFIFYLVPILGICQDNFKQTFTYYDFQFQNKQYFFFFCILHTKYSGMNRERWGFTGDESPLLSVIPFISIKDVNTTAPKNFHLKSKFNTS